MSPFTPVYADYKQADAESYNATAAAFDALTERFAGELAAELVAEAAIKANDRVLDVGTGTGLVALRAARAASAVQVVGIDHSPGMLERARAKATSFGLKEAATFQEMDAEQLRLPPASFDVAVSLFTLRHLPQPSQAIAEIRRVLKPGGRAVLAVGGGPPVLSWAAAPRMLRVFAVRLGRIQGRILEAPGFLRQILDERGVPPAELGKLPPERAVNVRKLMRTAGFGRVRSFWRGGIAPLRVEDFWGIEATFGSAERMRLAALSAHDVAELKAIFIDRAQTVLARSGVLVYPYGARFYSSVVE